MSNELQSALNDIHERLFGDRRVHFAEVQATSAEDSRVSLSGAVLDTETRDTLLGALRERFPQVAFDDKEVAVLRRQPPRWLTVATNVSGLRGAPSSGAELLSEVLGSWRVERLRDEEKWTLVRQPDGYLGWVYTPYLAEAAAPEPTDMVVEPVALLRESPAADAAIVTRIPAGMAVAVTATFEEEWAQVELAGLPDGWLPWRALRPLHSLPVSEADRREQMVEDAFQFIGVPYRWGGVTALGIDCSGFVQMLHRMVGVAIPRDADQQMDGGQAVEPPLQPGDLLFFGSDGAHRKISHVGMSLGGWQMIHSSGSRNGVYLDDLEERTWLRDIYVGAATYVGG
ncbi:MAG: NlpC/P60 family protein [Anaerolineae bacterium]|nr:NlpC/P60 family protein [Anaerolineae bacterium]